MTVSNSRNRLVVFRLTQNEYDALKGACSERGGRNLSEFTRAELLATVRSDSLDDVMRKGFSEVERRLDALRGSLADLTERLGVAAGDEAGPSTEGENK